MDGGVGRGEPDVMCFLSWCNVEYTFGIPTKYSCRKAYPESIQAFRNNFQFAETLGDRETSQASPEGSNLKIQKVSRSIGHWSYRCHWDKVKWVVDVTILNQNRLSGQDITTKCKVWCRILDWILIWDTFGRLEEKLQWNKSSRGYC